MSATKPTSQEGWTSVSTRSANHYFRDGKPLCKSRYVRLHKWDNGNYFIMESYSAGRCQKCMKARGKELGKPMDYRGTTRFSER